MNKRKRQAKRLLQIKMRLEGYGSLFFYMKVEDVDE